MASYPEPPAVGGEVETLLGSLERQRATFAYKCGALTDEQVRRTLGASQVTIAGLLKHLAYRVAISPRRVDTEIPATS